MAYSDRGQTPRRTSSSRDPYARSRSSSGRQGGSRSGSGSGARLNQSSRGRSSRNSRGYSLQQRSIHFDGRNTIFERLDIDPRKLLVLILAVLLVILLIVGVTSCVRGCSSPKEDIPVNATDSRVASGISEGLTKDLGTALDRNTKVSQIAQNANAYTDERLVELALAEPTAVDLVAAYPDAEKTASAYDSSVEKGTAPELYDWDERWGYVDYAGSALAVTGSGPTALAMARMGLTGATDQTPADIAAAVTSAGLAVGDSSMDATFLTDNLGDLGLECKSYESSADNITAVLDAGTYLMLEVNADTLTDATHWVLVTTQNQDGSVVVYDPTSTAVSSRPWDPGTISSSSTGKMYALTASQAAGDDGSSSSSSGK